MFEAERYNVVVPYTCYNYVGVQPPFGNGKYL